MAHGPRYHIPFRRRREGKTDYRARLAMIRSGKPRAVVRMSNSGSTVQIVKYHDGGDIVLTQASYMDLKKLGWSSSLRDTPAAYLVGLLAGVRAKKGEVEEAVLDIGLYEPVRGSRIFASLKGLLDAGMEIPHGEEMFPDDGRIAGKNKGVDGMTETFDNMKKKILEM